MSELNDVKRKNYVKYLSLVVFIGLLFLRYPLLIIPRFFFQTNIPNEFLMPAFFNIHITDMMIRSIFENGTYLLTAILMLLNKDRLAQFKLNAFALFIFLSAPILCPIVYKATGLDKHGFGFSRFRIIVSVILFLCLILTHTRVHKDNLKYHIKWIIISIVVGVLYTILSELPYIHLHKLSISYFGALFIYQLSSAAICEEPLFRGFIWGYLEKRGWKQFYIWLFQAGIFCFAHLYYLPQYPIFFIRVFITALVLGALVWRSKSIGTSMIVHGITNSLGDILTQL